MTIRVTGFAPLIQVFDMKASLAFYCDVLGFKLARRSQEGEAHFDWCMLERDGHHLMLNTAYERDERPAAPDPERHAHHADTAFYFACADVESAYNHLRAKGCKVSPPQQMHYGAREITVADPDGFLVSFQQFD
jgi:uncharacterized glyoxalase superfamily protein PhnB